MRSEKERIEQIKEHRIKQSISKFLSHPYKKQLPYLSSLKYLDLQIQQTVELLIELGGSDDNALDEAPVDASSGDDQGLDLEEIEEEDIEDVDEEGQSYFAWLADFVVVINAGTMAAVGFNDAITPLLTGVGYFASIFFIVEAYAKSLAYGGLGYYLLEGSNLFDFILVVIPTVGEITTQITDALGLGDDYIYEALALQAMRVFRIVKLTKHLTGLKNLTARAFGSPAGVLYALLVTIGFVCFMAFFGNELFGDEVQFAMERNDFQFFLSSMKTMLEFMLGSCGCVYVYVYVYVCARVRACVCVSVCVCVHTYIHTHTRTRT